MTSVTCEEEKVAGRMSLDDISMLCSVLKSNQASSSLLVEEKVRF